MIYRAMRPPVKAAMFYDSAEGTMTAGDVIVSDEPVRWTGLYDHNETPIYRLPDPVGFMRRTK